MPRTAEAARNDAAILAAARAVFIADPAAPIAAVAERAGVGVSALYRRYLNKDDLVRTLCADGLAEFIAIAEASLQRDPADCLDAFITGVVDADVHSLTVHLAGTFPTTPELGELAAQANRLAAAVFKRARSAKAVRSDVHVNDLPMIFEQLAAIRLGPPERVASLRNRYLTLHLQALKPGPHATKLPGTPPTDDEHAARWATHQGAKPPPDGAATKQRPFTAGVDHGLVGANPISGAAQRRP